ncbi:hypothetical protein CspHIS471_0103280 [Cutaneotrichosporon sp. HIS471]|nr:hypothetical protein CspHIS471_0103280 [Cutaneotrichosporon sp. HIS471]
MPGGAVGPVSAGNVFKTGLFPRQYLWAFILVTSLFFLWGFAYGLLDVLNKHFQNTLGVTTSQTTGLQAAYFGIGYFAFSPVAGEVLRRRGYKFTIIMGLCLYSLGAILFWPVAKSAGTSTNKQGIFGGFVVCTAVIACGLSTLEVSANSYVSVMPPISIASLRLQFSQAFNGVASFSGPLIASKYFFADPNSTDLTSVQWVYLAVSGMGMIVAIAFFFTKLPEVSENDLELDQVPEHKQKSIWKETRCLTGALAQFLYVGAQVSIGALFLYYTHEGAGISDARGSQLLSYALILFTVGRFVVTGLLSIFTAPTILFVFGVICTVIAILISTLHGMAGVACLMMIMFFESCMYPCIFTLATSGLGHNTRRGASIVVMGVSGGAVFPPMQAAIKDAYSARVSFFIVVPCFLYISCWAAYTWVLDGRQTFALKAKNVDQTADIETISVISADGKPEDIRADIVTPNKL